MRISIEDRLYMDCPEGFRELTAEEKNAMNLPEGKSLGISDPERHIIITVGWNKISGFQALLLGRREVSWNMSRQIEKRMKPFSFVWLDDVSRNIDGQLARGLDYEYVSNGINMMSESLVIKLDDNLYYFHMYARKARKEESLAVFNEILDGVAIVEL